MHYRISNGTTTIDNIPSSDLLNQCDELSAQGGSLTIVSIDNGVETIILKDGTKPAEPPASLIIEPVKQEIVQKAPKQFSEFGHGKQIMDEANKARVEGLHAVLAGNDIHIDTSQQLFDTGTRLAREGYAKQDAARKEFEDSELLVHLAEEFTQIVNAEEREDQTCTAKDVADGLELKDGVLKVFGLTLQEQAIRGLCGQLNSPLLGYMAGIRRRIQEERERGVACDTKMVDVDLGKIADDIQYECMRRPNEELKLRTRRTNQDVFAITAPAYAAYDAPAMIKELMRKIPAGTRGTYYYDPITVSWVLTADVFTPTPTHEQVVGEPFKGSARFRSNDAGQGSFRGGGNLVLVRCLNASTYESGTGDGRRVHRGRVVIDAAKIIANAAKAITVLIDAWGVNRTMEVPVEDKIVSDQFIAGLFRALLRDRSSEYAGVLPGRCEKHVPLLAATYETERRNTTKIVRSDLAQALTRYAQNFDADVIDATAVATGSWLNRTPRLRCDTEE